MVPELPGDWVVVLFLFDDLLPDEGNPVFKFCRFIKEFLSACLEHCDFLLIEV